MWSGIEPITLSAKDKKKRVLLARVNNTHTIYFSAAKFFDFRYLYPGK
jgi:hypothetical protein